MFLGKMAVFRGWGGCFSIRKLRFDMNMIYKYVVICDWDLGFGIWGDSSFFEDLFWIEMS